MNKIVIVGIIVAILIILMIGIQEYFIAERIYPYN